MTDTLFCHRSGTDRTLRTFLGPLSWVLYTTLVGCTVREIAPPPPPVVYQPQPQYASPPVPVMPMPPTIVRVYVDPPMIQPQPVLVDWAPPPRLAENPSPMPYYGAVWIGGYWIWQGTWVWASGRWAAPPSPRHTWVQPYYEHRQGKMLFIPGFWAPPGAAFAPPPPHAQIPYSPPVHQDQHQTKPRDYPTNTVGQDHPFDRDRDRDREHEHSPALAVPTPSAPRPVMPPEIHTPRNGQTEAPAGLSQPPALTRPESHPESRPQRQEVVQPEIVKGPRTARPATPPPVVGAPVRPEDARGHREGERRAPDGKEGREDKEHKAVMEHDGEHKRE